MQSQTVLNARASDRLLSASLAAITRQMEDLKQVGPEWDGPGSITPEADVIDRVAAWLIGNWRADLGIPDICPTAEGGVSISWEWGAIEHSIDVRAGGASTTLVPCKPWKPNCRWTSRGGAPSWPA